MISIVLSVVLYLISMHFKSKADMYVPYQNTYYLCVAVATVLLIVGLVGIITSLWSRASFCLKLKRMCKTKGYDYKGVRNPFLSLIISYGGEDIVLTRRDKVLRLKFFPYLMSRRFVHIINGEKAEFANKIAFLGGFIRPRAPGHVYSGSKNWIIWNSLFRYNRRIDLSFSKDTLDNIVIIPQKCREMTFVEGNSQSVVGSGQQLGNKKLYFQKDFLNYFDRV